VSIRPVSSTMGVSTPATVGEGARPYRYRGIKDWTPNDSRYRDLPAKPHPQNARTSAERAARVAEYARLRLEEKATPEEAADRLGLGRSTRGQYDREFRAQQQGEGAP